MWFKNIEYLWKCQQVGPLPKNTHETDLLTMVFECWLNWVQCFMKNTKKKSFQLIYLKICWAQGMDVLTEQYQRTKTHQFIFVVTWHVEEHKKWNRNWKVEEDQICLLMYYVHVVFT